MAPLAHTLALLAMAVATAAIKVVDLDMARYSFDDQYRGCSRAMTAALPALSLSEVLKNPDFAEGWANAEKEWQRQGSPLSPLLSSAQSIAIMAYSGKDVYKEFNIAVRAAGRSPQEYRDCFHYKSFHFLLTQALVTLRDAQNSQCRHVFRGIRRVQFKAEPNKIVRFGEFALTSLSKKVAEDYGTDTMFHVRTCYGVDITNFSYDSKNQEVLIPPYEKFNVTKVAWEGGKQQIHLNSTGNYSKYDCEWLKGDTTGGSVSMAPFHLGGLLLATTALAVATGIL